MVWFVLWTAGDPIIIGSVLSSIHFHGLDFCALGCQNLLEPCVRIQGSPSNIRVLIALVLGLRELFDRWVDRLWAADIPRISRACPTG